MVRESINAANVLFDVSVLEFNFSLTVIESAVWYVLARSLRLTGDLATALREVNPPDAREVTETLRGQGLDPKLVAGVLCLVATARAHASVHRDVALTHQRYKEVRREVLDELSLESGRGSTVWPPTSQTVMKRLGGAFWTDA